MTAYTKGLHDLGQGCYAYLQPDGGWGYSNAGLIEDQGETLLVDTLIDLPLTREMLEAMRKAIPEAAHIDTLINTHSDPDHTFGNQLVSDAVIVSSRACLEEMQMHIAPPTDPRGHIRFDWQNYGDTGRFLNEMLWTRFSAEGFVPTLPSETFSGEKSLHVGSKELRLIEVGPAHTRGDVIVYVPGDRTVFTGDIMFVGGHPVVWVGPVQNWIDACDLMLGWNIETVVPGHGPITDKEGIRDLRDYLSFVLSESRKAYDSGIDWEQAAREVDLGAYSGWIDRERIAANFLNCYREFAGQEPPDRLELMTATARYYFDEIAS